MADVEEAASIETPREVSQSISEVNYDGSDRYDLSLVNVASREDTPPDGGYGWVCTACLFLINVNTWGVNSAWGIFLAYYLDHSTFKGSSPLQFALIGGLSISQSLLISPLVAILNRRLGSRFTMLLGSSLISVAWLGASFATQIWHLFLTIGLTFGWGMGFLYITASLVVPQWFSTRRSLAVGMATSGAGLGGLAYNLGAGAMVPTFDLPWTYRTLACLTLAFNVICSILLRDRNKTIKPSQQSFDYNELRRIEVSLVIVWGFLTELGYIVLLYSLPHYASSIGLSSQQGSIVGAMLNLGLGLGRPFVGYYSDTIGRLNMATMMTASCGLICLALWIPAHAYGILLTFALLAGTVCGTFWGTVTAVTTEVVGLKRLPTSFGIVCVALVIPTTFAEPIGLGIVSASGYLTAQIFVGLTFLLGAASLVLLRGWKIEQVEQKSFLERASREEIASRKVRTLQWLSPHRVFSWRRV